MVRSLNLNPGRPTLFDEKESIGDTSQSFVRCITVFCTQAFSRFQQYRKILRNDIDKEPWNIRKTYVTPRYNSRCHRLSPKHFEGKKCRLGIYNRYQRIHFHKCFFSPRLESLPSFFPDIKSLISLSRASTKPSRACMGRVRGEAGSSSVLTSKGIYAQQTCCNRLQGISNVISV